MSSCILGVLYLALLFFFCFAIVYFVKLANILIKGNAKKQEPPLYHGEKPAKEVFYLVERKKVKKPKYKYSESEPQQITFKN